MNDQGDFRDQAGLAGICRGLLYAQVALAAFGVLSAWWTYDLLGSILAGEAVNPSAMDADDARTMIVGLLTFGLYVVGVIAIGIWIYRANRNAQVLSVQDMEFSPGWAIGWYVVPLANLVMPFRAMREIHDVSARVSSEDENDADMMLRGWWAAWLTMNVTGWISFRMALNFQTAEGLQVSSAFDLVSCLLTIPACLLLAAIIGRIQSFQDKAANRLTI